MKAWSEMERAQGGVFKKLDESERKRIANAKELHRFNGLILEQLIDQVAAMQYSLPGRPGRQGAQHVMASTTPTFGGNWDFSKFDNELSKTNNAVGEVADTTVEWSDALTDLARSSNPLNVTGGLSGQLAQLAF